MIRDIFSIFFNKLTLYLTRTPQLLLPFVVFAFDRFAIISEMVIVTVTLWNQVDIHVPVALRSLYT